MSDIDIEQEIFKEFFKAFGIGKRPIYLVMDMGKSHICNKEMVILNKELFAQKSRRCYVKAVNKVYPEITDRILLELICILNLVTKPDLGDISYHRLRMTIIEQCIESLKKVDWQNREPSQEEFIQEVRDLFEEE